jgi:hypothetical protein
MSVYQKYMSAYNPRARQVIKIPTSFSFTSKFNNRVSIKFYNFFMKFRSEKDERNETFYWKNQKLFKGLKILELEEYKIEQIKWIQQYKCGSDISLLIYMCKARIKYFLDVLKDYMINKEEISQILDEGYKVTIQSSLRPKTIKLNTKAFNSQMSSFFLGIIQANNVKLQTSDSSAFKTVNFTGQK